jgi:hypothetical protein
MPELELLELEADVLELEADVLELVVLELEADVLELDVFGIPPVLVPVLALALCMPPMPPPLALEPGPVVDAVDPPPMAPVDVPEDVVDAPVPCGFEPQPTSPRISDKPARAMLLAEPRRRRALGASDGETGALSTRTMRSPPFVAGASKGRAVRCARPRLVAFLRRFLVVRNRFLGSESDPAESTPQGSRFPECW